MASNSENIAPIVQSDSYLTLHYRIEFTSGPAARTIFADTFTDRPATLQMGAGQWSEAMETPLIGLQEGDQLEFDLPAAKAYGEHNPDLTQQISKEILYKHGDSKSELELGEVIEFMSPNGENYSGILKQIADTWVLIDFNHPLAGHDLRVEVYLLGVL